MSSNKAPRGIRNHNPFNLRRSKDPWQGLAPKQTDPEFFQFISAPYGIRNGMRTLITYQDKHGLNTVRKIINRFAPPVENDTDAYIDHVAGRLGCLTPDDPIDVHDGATMLALADAVIRHENGVNPYDDVTMRKALVLAGIDIPMKPVEESRTLKAGTVAAGTTAVGAALDPVMDAVAKVEPLMPIIQQAMWYGKWALVALALGAVGYMAWRYLQDRKLRVA